jgi:hypothetical protein
VIGVIGVIGTRREGRRREGRRREGAGPEEVGTPKMMSVSDRERDEIS